MFDFLSQNGTKSRKAETLTISDRHDRRTGRFAALADRDSADRAPRPAVPSGLTGNRFRPARTTTDCTEHGGVNILGNAPTAARQLSCG